MLDDAMPGKHENLLKCHQTLCLYVMSTLVLCTGYRVGTMEQIALEIQLRSTPRQVDMRMTDTLQY